jgi:spermidine synthase
MNSQAQRPEQSPETNRSVERSDRLKHRLLMVLLFFSGASALIYQIVWTRMLVATFGATVYAMGTVVTAFMAGLALGSYLFGRYVDRGRPSPLVLYGVLEIGICIFALFFPAILRSITACHIAAFQRFSASFHVFTLLRFILCTAALIVPTTLMGATLPVVVKFAARSLSGIGSTIASLYAVNTFGAMFGAFAAGFFLIELIGVRASFLLAALINASVGITAIAVGMLVARGALQTQQRVGEGGGAGSQEAGGSPTLGHPGPQDRPGTRLEPRGAGPGFQEQSLPPAESHLILLGAGIAGLAALSNEVLWTRIMVFVLGNFVHSFTLVLMSFLFGIALGSSVISRVLDRPGVGLRLFAGFQFGIGIAALALIPLFAPLIGLRESFLNSLTGAGVALDAPDPWWPFTLWKMGIAFAMLVVPTFLMGASFPLATKIYVRATAGIGRGVGNVYAVNTLGAIIGSFLASFVLVGALGIRISALTTASLSVALGLVILWFAPSRRSEAAAEVPHARSKRSSRRHHRRSYREVEHAPALSGAFRIAALGIGAGFVAIAFAAIPEDIFVRMYATAEENMSLVYVDESVGGTVTAHRAPSGNRVLDINGLNVAGTKFGFLVTQKLQAHFPLLCHPDPKNVMQIGFGSGGTCWSISTHPGVEHIDCIEISPAVIKGAERFFQDINNGVLRDPRVKLVIEDARNFVLATNRRYDIILSDSIHPRYVGNGNLYTKEYFELCCTKLTENGILSFWLPTYLLSVDDYRMIVRTLHSVFPHVVIWYMNNTVEAYSVAMGSMKPIMLDCERVRRALEHERVNSDLAAVRMNDPIAIADCLILHGPNVSAFVGEGPLNTEDKPLIEFRAPRNMIRERGEWMNLRELASARRFPDGIVTNYGATDEDAAEARACLERCYAATSHVISGHLYHIMGQLDEELEAYNRAVEINPDDADVPYLAARAHKIMRGERLD